MRALWSDRPKCSHNVSQKVKRIRRLSDLFNDVFDFFLCGLFMGVVEAVLKGGSANICGVL